MNLACHVCTVCRTGADGITPAALVQRAARECVSGHMHNLLGFSGTQTARDFPRRS